MKTYQINYDTYSKGKIVSRQFSLQRGKTPAEAIRRLKNQAKLGDRQVKYGYIEFSLFKLVLCLLFPDWRYTPKSQWQEFTE